MVLRFYYLGQIQTVYFWYVHHLDSIFSKTGRSFKQLPFSGSFRSNIIKVVFGPGPIVMAKACAQVGGILWGLMEHNLW